MSLTESIHPDVRALIKPIIDRSTQIWMAEQQARLNVGQLAQPIDQKSADKLQCVHLIWKNGNVEPALYRTQSGKMKCAVCGREINTTFDDSAVDAILKARAVVEQLMFFGMTKNMKCEHVNMLIQMKIALTTVAQMVGELNQYVTRTNTTADSISGVGVEYAVPNPITSM
jgi:hypothetical protein